MAGSIENVNVAPIRLLAQDIAHEHNVTRQGRYRTASKKEMPARDAPRARRSA
jgi:hypothetical protein